MAPLKPASESRPHSLGLHVSDAELAGLIPLFETFSYSPKSSALRWILEHPSTKEIIRERIMGEMIPS